MIWALSFIYLLTPIKNIFCKFVIKNIMIAVKQPLSNVQIELLKIFSTNITEPELKELKDLIAQFYAKKSIELANNVWEEKKLSNDLMDKWLNED